MTEEEFRKITDGLKDKYCDVYTTAGILENVVFLKSNRVNGMLQMIIRATGNLRERLKNIAGSDGKTTKNNEYGIPVEFIISIEFKS